jgi:hypothetical protein
MRNEENYTFEDNYIEELNEKNFNKFQYARFSKYTFCQKFLAKYNMKIKEPMEKFNPNRFDVDDGTLQGRVMSFQQIKEMIKKQNKQKQIQKGEKNE